MIGFSELILVMMVTVLPCLGIIVVLGILLVVILLIRNNRQKGS